METLPAASLSACQYRRKEAFLKSIYTHLFFNLLGTNIIFPSLKKGILLSHNNLYEILYAFVKFSAYSAYSDRFCSAYISFCPL